jgi:endonuclease YncB( thermonuclease family)
MAKAKRPPDGLTIGVNFLRAIDGDTIDVTGLVTSLLWRVRLKDCWCYETKDSDESLRTIALEAKRETEALCKLAGDGLRVHIPFDGDYLRHVRSAGKSINPLHFTTFDRVPAIVWIDDKTTLNQKLIEMGLASSTKEGSLGA